jgi:hypothetical protein
MSRALHARSFFVILMLYASTSVPMLAQVETATLSGAITDPRGGVVPDVEITATRIETGTVLTTQTNGAGIYFFTGLLPGHYHLMIHKPGFKEIAIKEFELHVQDKLEQNFALEIGSVSETVTVTANDLNVNTTDASVSTVIDRNFVAQLPLNGRSFNTLLQLTPGVVIAPASTSSPGQFSIAGQRTDANNFTVDGVSANFGVVAGSGQAQSGTGTAPAFSALGSTSSLVSVDALQEFRVETSSFAPEFGRSPGGQVILSTRSGTSDFHGGLFDYFRNTVMDANDWFAKQAGDPRPPVHNNDFGGFLGGPIWKDKTFFFVSYEGARLDLPQGSVISVPSDYAKTQATTNAPQVLPFLNAYPQPDPGQPEIPGVYTAKFTASYANRASLDAGSVRIDHTFNDRFSLFGRYNDAPSQIMNRVFSLNEIQTSSVNTRTLTIGVNMMLTNRVSNTVRVNYSTQRTALSDQLDSFGGATPLNASLLLGTLPAAENQASFFSTETGIYSVGLAGNPRTSQLNFVDAVSISLGKHQLKFGGDYRDIFLDTSPAQHGVVALVFSLQSFVSGPTAGQVLLTTGMENPARLLTQALSLFGQDTWRIGPRLTLTYGLRWELSPPPSSRGSTTLASWTNTDDPAKMTLAPSGTPVWSTTYGNFAPRAGIAYSLTDKGDFVLRAGGGIFYDLGLGQSASLAGAFPNTLSNLAFGVSIPISNVTPYLPAPASLQPPFPSNVSAFADNLKLPYSFQWNVALEKSFGGTQAVSATYVGQSGRRLLRNEALFEPNSNFDGGVYLDANDARSNYNALQVQYRRSLSGGLQALLNYSWSHSLDNASNDVLLGLPNTVVSGASDYASSDFDVRQSFSGALRYSIPSAARSGLLSLLTKDWSIDTVIVARTGFPFNATLTSVSLDPGGNATTRPDRVAGQPLYLYGAQCASELQASGGLGNLAPGEPCPGGKGLNPSAFSMPSTIRQGTEGRNDILGFGLTEVDLSVGRQFPITERINLQFRADAFNILNHPNFANPAGPMSQNSNGVLVFNGGGVAGTMLNQGLSSGLGGGLSPLFQEGGPRSLQLSLRLSF